MKQTFLLFMLFFSIKANAQKNGVYINFSTGINKYWEHTLPTVSLNTGVIFNRHIISIYNQAGYQHIKLGGLEYNYLIKAKNKLYYYPIISIIPINTFFAYDKHVKEVNYKFVPGKGCVNTTKRIAGDIGVGVKRYNKHKFSFSFSIRASVFEAKDINDKIKIALPIYTSIGIGL